MTDVVRPPELRSAADSVEPRRSPSRFAWCLAILMVLFLLGVLLVHATVGDTSLWGEYITLWPPLFWAFGAVLLVPFLFLARDKSPAIVLVLSIFLFVAIAEEWRSVLRPFLPFTYRTDVETSPSSIRVATWNISGGGARMAGLKRLEELKVDICFFQECPGDARHYVPEGASSWWEGSHWVDSGDCGILSRIPVKLLEEKKVGPWPEVQILSATPENQPKLLICNVHLALPSLGLNLLSMTNRDGMAQRHRERIDQFPQLAELIQSWMKREETQHVVLAGDFNTPAGMRSLDPLRAFLRDAWVEAGQGWGRTMTNQFPVSRIDQCWVSSKVKVLDSRVYRVEESDHRLLWAHLLLY